MNDFNLFFTAIKDEDDIKFKPRDFRGIIAIDDAGDAWVIAATQDCRDVDLFDGNLLSDNGCVTPEGLNVGIYSCRFRPWSDQCREGDYDCGIDLENVELIALAPEEFLMEKINK